MSSREITHLLGDIDPLREWTQVQAAEACECLRKALAGAKLDWDRDAGETWGRLLVEKEPVIVVSSLAPVALVRTPVDSKVLVALDQLGVAPIAFSEWDSPEFSADPAVVMRVFHRQIWSEAVDPNLFSASELWWMTV